MEPEEPKLADLPKVRFTRVEPLDVNIRVDLPDRQFSGVEFEPIAGKHYMFTIETHGRSPSDVQTILQDAHRTLTRFMPKGCPFLVVPVKNGMPDVGIYEITPEP